MLHIPCLKSASINNHIFYKRMSLLVMRSTTQPLSTDIYIISAFLCSGRSTLKPGVGLYKKHIETKTLQEKLNLPGLTKLCYGVALWKGPHNFIERPNSINVFTCSWCERTYELNWLYLILPGFLVSWLKNKGWADKNVRWLPDNLKVPNRLKVIRNYVFILFSFETDISSLKTKWARKLI